MVSKLILLRFPLELNQNDIWYFSEWNLNYRSARYIFLFQADQLVTQKITGTEVTKFDDDFSKLEKASDIYIDLQVFIYFLLDFEKLCEFCISLCLFS